MLIKKPIFNTLLPLLGTLVLAGCTSMANLPAGSTLAAVEAQYGKAGTVCQRDDGSQRMVWSTQPLGQYAWGTNVNTAGVIDRITLVLSDPNFQQLGSGNWTEAQVICEFGPPAEISWVGLPSSSHKVFSYRYKQNGAWDSLMYVYFDKYSGLVNRFHAGPDPLFEPYFFGGM